MFRLRRDKESGMVLLIFIAASYAIDVQHQVRHEFELCQYVGSSAAGTYVGQLVAFASLAKRRSNVVLAVSVVIVCAIEFHQYIILAVNFPLYELITPHLLRAFGILKDNLGP